MNKRSRIRRFTLASLGIACAAVLLITGGAVRRSSADFGLASFFNSFKSAKPAPAAAKPAPRKAQAFPVSVAKIETALNDASGVALDTSVSPSRLYVADTGNHRVLGWASVKDYLNGQPPSFAVGQPDFATVAANSRGLGAESLSSPTGVAVDKAGNLYVADTGNNRVLRFDSPFAGDLAADQVWGQADFESNAFADGKGLNHPTGVAVGRVPGEGETLFVADQGNGRVAAFATTGKSPKYVLAGETLAAPFGVAVDVGDLYVTDSTTGQISVFDVQGKKRGFVRAFAGPGVKIDASLAKSSFRNLGGVAASPFGGFYVADSGNGRLFEYMTPSYDEDFDADRVIGGSNRELSHADFDGVPTAVAVDRDGTIFIAASGSKVLKVLPSAHMPKMEPAKIDPATTSRIQVGANIFPGVEAFGPPSATTSFTRVPAGLTNLWTFNPPVTNCEAPTDVAGHSAPNCAAFRNASSCNYVSPSAVTDRVQGSLRTGTSANVSTIDLTAQCNPGNLVFNYLLDTDLSSLTQVDRAFVEIRTSTTSTFAGAFTIIASTPNIGTGVSLAETGPGNFVPISIPLPAAAANRFVQVQWRFDSVLGNDPNPGSNLFAGFYIDDVNITANNAAPTVSITSTPAPLPNPFCAGSGSVTFTATASGGGTFQWRRNGVAIPGANANTFTIGAPTPADSGSYDCQLTNGCGTGTSNALLLNVQGQPAFGTLTANPNPYCAVGANVTLTLAGATGATEFRLQRSLDGGVNFANIGAAQPAPTFVRTTVGADNGAVFRILAGNSCFSVAGGAASLVAIPGVPTVQLQLASPVTSVSIAAAPSATVCAGSNVTFNATVIGGPATTFVWTGPGGVIADGGRFSGATTNALTITGVIAADAGNYSVTASNNCPPPQASNIVPLTVSPIAVPGTTFAGPTGGPTVGGTFTTCPGNILVDLSGGTPPGAGVTYTLQKSTSGGPFTTVAGPQAANSFTVPVVFPGDNGARYQILTTTSCGTVTATFVTVNVNEGAPTAVTLTYSVNGGPFNPGPVTICAGQNLSIRANTTGGTPNSFTWTGPGGVIVNGGRFSGATTNTLTITGIQSPADSGNYSVTAGNFCGSVASAVEVVTVTPALTNVIATLNGVQTPPPVVTCASANAILTFALDAATTANATSFQWQRSTLLVGPFNNIPGATASTFVIAANAATIADAGFYRCIVSNACSLGAASNTLELVVNPTLPPTITTVVTPNVTVICENNSISFSVPSIVGVTYEWRQNNVAGSFPTNSGTTVDGGQWAGAFTPNLLLTNTKPSQAATAPGYVCVLTNPNCAPPTVTSSAAPLTVNQRVTAPVATTITEASGVANDGNICVAATATLSVPTFIGATYQWLKGPNPIANGGNFSGATTNILTITNAVVGDSGTYRCLITPAANCGDPAVNSQAVVITVTPPLPNPINTTLTVNGVANTNNPATVCEGANLVLGLNPAITGAGITFEWFFGGVSLVGVPVANVTGANTNTLTITGATMALNQGTYQCLVTNPCGFVQSTLLTINVVPNTSALVATITENSGTPNDGIACVGSTVAFTCTGGPLPGPGVTYEWIFNGGPAAIANGAGTLGTVTGADTPTMTIAGTTFAAAGTYFCRVTTLCGSRASNIVNLQMQQNQLPSFPLTATPSLVVCAGPATNVTFTPTTTPAGGYGPGTTFQWLFNGTPITNGAFNGATAAGATTDTLTLTGVTVACSGNYTLQITNSCGVITSAPAGLNAVASATITINPPQLNVNPGDPAVFTATIAGGTGGTVQWFFDADCAGPGAPVPINTGGNINITIAPGPTGSTLTISPVNTGNAGCYFLRLTGGTCGSVDSAPATLSILGVVQPFLLAADTDNNRVQVFNGALWSVLPQPFPAFNRPEAVSGNFGPNNLPNPISGTGPFDDVIYVADTANNRVMRSINSGQTWQFVATVSLPTGIAVSPGGGVDSTVYVSDGSNRRVIRFTFAGGLPTPATTTILATNGVGVGQVGNPHGLAVNLANTLVIADQGRSQILQILNAHTTLLTNTGTVVAGQGLAPNQVQSPQGVGLDNGGNIYVADTGNNRVTFYPGGNAAGAVVLTNGIGTLPGRVGGPEGVTVAQLGANAVLVVSDTLNDRIQSKTNPTTPDPSGATWTVIATQGSLNPGDRKSVV